MRKLKVCILSFTILIAAFFSFLGVKTVAASGDNENLTLTLEQQETKSGDTVTNIRYICTLGGVTNLADITDLKINFYRYKYGNKAYKASDTIETVYESVAGANGKDAATNTYYAVYTLTNVDDAAYKDWTLTASFTATTSTKTVTSNEISYTINDSGDTFIKSMDASAVPALESVGVKYYNVDSETSEDVYKILADNGVNYIRVRIWNDPTDSSGNGYGGGNCDLDNAIAIGKRANKYGMKILADFQYSDFWADPGKQILPKAWADYSTEQIKNAVYTFTKESLTTMKEANIDVGMVQVGNETNDSMCGIMGEESMSTICSFMSQGSKAVREIYPNALVALHFANPSNTGNYTWYASELKSAGVDYDVFGTSYYPYWHGSQSNLTTVLTKIATTYNKKVMILETSYANCEMDGTSENSDGYGNTVYTKAYTESQYGDYAALPYAFTVAGQKQQIEDLMDLIAGIKTSTNQYGIGVSYWEGTWISTAKYAAALGLSKEEMWNEYGTGWASTYANDYYQNFANNYSDWLSTSGQSADDYTISSAGGCVIENEAFFDEDGHAYASIAAFKHEVSSTTDVTKPLTSMSIDATSALSNPGFENAWDVSGWNVSGTLASWPIKAAESGSGATGDRALNFYNESTTNFSLSQTISGIDSGTYTFEMDTYGSSTIVVTLYATINGNTTSVNNTMCTTLATWSSPTTLTFSCSSTDTVVIGISIYDSNTGSWGWLDNAVLTRIA